MVDVDNQRTLEAIARGIVEELNRRTDLEWIQEGSTEFTEGWRVYDTPHVIFTISLDNTSIVVIARDLIEGFMYEDPSFIDGIVDCIKKHPINGRHQ